MHIFETFFEWFPSQLRLTEQMEETMIHRAKKLLTLKDLIQTVSEFARNEHETALAVADLINRGVVRFVPRTQPVRLGASRRRF